FFMQKQLVEAPILAQLINLIHLDRIKWANLHANLATHADRDINIENAWMFLRFPFFVALQDDIDALGRAFLLANFACHAAQSLLRIIPIKNQKREVSRVLLKRKALLRILHRGKPLRIGVALDEVSRGLFQTLYDT